MDKKVFFTSDTHFDHGNVIRYCDRPFAFDRGMLVRPSTITYVKDIYEVRVDIAAMNRAMVERWNATVAPFDIIYHLGDVAMGKRANLGDVVRRLNGHKILVRGNHDRSKTAMLEAGFDEVHESLNITLDGVKLYLHHQPEVKARWGGAEIHLCGHVHEKWRRKGPMINVGVDQWDFTPRSLQELLAAPKQGDWPSPEEMD